jgi:hypothetical protein
MCTTSFLILKMIYSAPTQCIYAFNFRISSINRFVFIMEVQFVFCEVETEFLNRRNWSFWRLTEILFQLQKH